MQILRIKVLIHPYRLLPESRVLVTNTWTPYASRIPRMSAEPTIITLQKTQSINSTALESRLTSLHLKLLKEVSILMSMNSVLLTEPETFHYSGRSLRFWICKILSYVVHLLIVKVRQ